MAGEAKLTQAEMLPIAVPSGSQPCDIFGVHPSLPFLKQLYDEGDASFVANIGSLVEPVDRASYYDGSARLPPQVFAHNMGTKAAQSLHPQALGSKGVLGRALDALAAQPSPVRGGLYSIAGKAKIVDIYI